MLNSIATKGSEQKKTLAILVLVTIASVLASLFMVNQEIWLDDSFISFRYAKNLHNGLGLVFNAGERVEGYTNFLWTLFSYVGIKLGFEAINFSHALSIFAQAVTLYLIFTLGNTVSRTAYWALLAPVFLAFNVAFVSYPAMGMETTFFTMLVILAFVCFSRNVHQNVPGGLVVGAILLGIALTRFDGFVLVLIMLGYRVLVAREIKKNIPVVLVFVVGLALYNFWRLSYYPTPLPNTFYAKVGFSMQQLWHGMKYVLHFFVDSGHYLIILGIASLLQKRISPLVRFAAWVVSWQLVYIILVGGDWMPYFRFIIPVLPLLFFLMQEGLWSVFERMKSVQRTGRLPVALAVVTSLLFFLFVCKPLVGASSFNRQMRGGFFRPLHARTIGLYLDKALPSDYVVAIEWAGIMPYYMHQRVLDTAGLTDRDIVLQDFPSFPMGRASTPEYIAGRKPHLIVTCAQIFDSLAEAVAGTTRRFSFLPEGNFVHDYYATLSSPGSPYSARIMKISDQAYWPVLVRRDLLDSQLFIEGDLIGSSKQEEGKR